MSFLLLAHYLDLTITSDSLTIDDELSRWMKYSYGCGELIFNPLKSWWRMGPITKQLRVFLWSGAAVHYKITMMSYMFSYCKCH